MGQGGISADVEEGGRVGEALSKVNRYQSRECVLTT